jgi:hypothetical protein
MNERWQRAASRPGTLGLMSTRRPAPIARLIPILLLVAAIGVAGCGSSSTKSSGSSSHSSAGVSVSAPLQSELSYFAAGSPFILSVNTDPNSTSVQNANALVNTIPLAPLGEAALEQKLESLGINYQTDIKPLLGNPISIGADTALPTGAAANNFLITWVASSASKLSALLAKVPGLHPSRTTDGAKVYLLGGTAAAIDGATLLFADNETDLDSALAHHAQQTGFTSADYQRDVAGLPQGSFMQAFGDLTAVLSGAKAAKARTIPWVGAIKGYGAAMNATASGLSIQYRVDTSGASLSSAELPLATGSTPPSLAGSEPITVGVSNPAHALDFILGAYKTLDPAKYAKAQPATIAALTSFLNQLSGNTVIASNVQTTVGRLALSDPSQAETQLKTLMTSPGLFNGGTKPTSLGGGFYAVADNSTVLTLGITGDQLVLGKASPAQLKAFAAQPATPAPAGTQGTLAFRVALPELFKLVLHTEPSGIAATVLNLLGDVTGSNQTSTSAMTGTATLAVK